MDKQSLSFWTMCGLNSLSFSTRLSCKRQLWAVYIGNHLIKAADSQSVFLNIFVRKDNRYLNTCANWPCLIFEISSTWNRYLFQFIFVYVNILLKYSLFKCYHSLLFSWQMFGRTTLLSSTSPDPHSKDPPDHVQRLFGPFIFHQ